MRIALTLLVILSLVLAGCWDRREADELAIVDAFGADWVNGQYQVTAEVINPRSVSPPGQGGGQATPGKPHTIMIAGRGSTPTSAWDDLERLSPRFVFWAPAEVFVIGEDLARHGIGPFLDALARDPAVRLTPRVFIAQGTAAAVLATRSTGMELSVGRDLSRLARTNRVSQSAGLAPRIYDLLRWDRQADRAAVVLSVALRHASGAAGMSFQLGESAVLEGDRLVAWIPSSMARMQLWLVGRFVRSTFDFPCPGHAGKMASFLVTHAGERTTPVVSGGRVQAVDLRLQAQAFLVHADCPVLAWPALEQAASAVVAASAWRTVDWARRNGYDIFGWGEDVNRHAPVLWTADYADAWARTLSQLPVTLQVRVTLKPTEYGLSPNQRA